MSPVPAWSAPPTSPLARFVLALLLSFTLMVLDYRGQQIEVLRRTLHNALYPLELIAAFPLRVGVAVTDFFQGSPAVRKRLAELEAEAPLLKARLLRIEGIEAENRRLRDLLNASKPGTDRAMIVELLEVSSEQFTRRILLARGLDDNIRPGQPVVDARGLMGQVVEITARTSRVILITDPAHATPVQVLRNGLRAIAFGTGSGDGLTIGYLSPPADIREGDTLVTSGLGGVFPAGYPVAAVTRVRHNPNEPFMDISALPIAQMGHHREVLVIWPAASAIARVVAPSAPVVPVVPAAPAAQVAVPAVN